MQAAGLNAMHLDSTMDAKERAKVLAKFKANPDAVLCNVGILTTGFDAPDIEVVILYRATTSLPLFLQMVGRGSRVTANKNQFTILDFGENIRRHGFWEHERVWSLQKKAIKSKQPPPCKNCPSCNALLYTSTRLCECGHKFEMKKHDQEAKFAELRLMDSKLVRAKAKVMTLEELAELSKAKIIKPFWVLHNLRSAVEARKFVQLMGWKEGWLHLNRDRFPNLK
jgi:superfamily II DNA or RNA helicase